MTTTDEVYDFIVVGSGPAGSAIAGRLSEARTAPKVLLLEAGSTNNPSNGNLLYDRYTSFLTYPEQSWGYETTPIAGLNNRTVPYARGKVLGGSSLLNFCAWTAGPRDDFDRWAAEVDDESFDWKHRAAMSQRMEALVDDTPAESSEYVKPNMTVHGGTGRITVSYPAAWERGVDDRFKSIKEFGWPIAQDLSGGNPLGIGLNASSSKAGFRVTATAYLADASSNLTIRCNSQVTKILFDGKTAVGVVANNKQYRASKEIIVSCGAIDSPKLLILSGVGPQAETEKHGIETVLNLPGVGRGAEDHLFCPFVWLEKTDSHSDWAGFHAAPDNLLKAREEFAASGTGPLATLHTGLLMGYFKADELLATQDFKALPERAQEHMKKPTVPLYEVTIHTPVFTPGTDPSKSYLTVVAYIQSPSSRGRITLKSANPKDAPLIDLNFFNHPADRAIARAAKRKILDFAKIPSIKSDILESITVPVDDSDAAIEAHWRACSSTDWHISCTVKMGRPDDAEVCLDSDFRVKKLRNLRVADLSSLPFLLNCHPQSVAYFIGETAAAKLIREYNL